MLSLTLSGLSLPTLQLPLKGLSTTFGSAPASQKLFGLNSTNIGAAHPPTSRSRAGRRAPPPTRPPPSPFAELYSCRSTPRSSLGQQPQQPRREAEDGAARAA